MVSKIVSDADRSTNIYKMISRSYAYNKSKGYEEDKIYNEVYTHLKEKYYERRYKFLSSELQKELNDAREILKNEEEFKRYLNGDKNISLEFNYETVLSTPQLHTHNHMGSCLPSGLM